MILGIDIGTSGTKIVVATADGVTIRSGTRAHSTDHPKQGWAEHDAEQTWWQPIIALIGEIVDGIADTITAVCVSGLGPCVLVTDAEGVALRPAILYGIDRRSAPQIARMRASLDDDDPRRSRLTTQSVGPKLAWLRDEEPQTWASARLVFTSHSHITFRLTGEYVIDRVSASWWDPFVSADGTAWLPGTASRWAPGIELPRIVEPDALVGELSPEAAAATGLPVGIAVHAGTIDYAAQITGSGAREPGDCVVVFGSTLSVNLITDVPHHGGTPDCSPGVAAGTWYRGGVTGAAGALLERISVLTGLDHGTLTELAEAIPAGSDGVLIMPSFAGDRSPVEDPLARGAILGLDLSHTPGHLYRAALESIAFSLRHILERLETASPAMLIASGGGAVNPVLMQAVADVTGIPVVVSTADGGAALGSCVLAGAVTASGPGDGTTYRPDTVAAARLDRHYGTYLLSAATLPPISHRISAGSRPVSSAQGQS